MELNLTYQNVFSTNLQEYEFEDELVCELGSAPAAFNEYLDYGMESKLYNSEFYNVSLMYDNVSNQIKLERLDFIDIPKIQPIFYIPNSMTNSMMFKINYPDTYHDPEYPYDNIMLSTRNNEMTVFSSGYVDYLRNGYNFDREAREQANRQQAISAVIAVAGAVGAVYTGGASLALSGAVLGAYDKLAANEKASAMEAGAVIAPGGRLAQKNVTYDDPDYADQIDWERVSLQKMHIQQYEDVTAARGEYYKGAAMGRTYAGIQIAQGITNGIAALHNSLASIEANNRNFQASLVQKQTMAVGAQGSADVDLMSIYARNRLVMHKYTLREQDLINLARVFYYTGYAHPLQEIPNWSSRYWFNYVQCTPYFNNEQTCVYHNYINDIKLRLATGVTVYHEHNGEYDLDQTKENWETWLID